MIGNQMCSQFTVNSTSDRKKTSAHNIYELKLYLQDGLTTCGQEAVSNSGNKHGDLESYRLDSNPAPACRVMKGR